VRSVGAAGGGKETRACRYLPITNRRGDTMELLVWLIALFALALIFYMS
jgi:hypothetical protein